MYEKMIFTNDEINELKNSDLLISKLIEVVGELNREYIPDNFTALVQSIVFQQISFKAATSIWNKFVDYISHVNPNAIIEAEFIKLRECGLSISKVNYIKNIAVAVNDNKIDFSKYHLMTNQEITDELIQVKGVGPWTAEMFLLFSLFRKDIINYKDLGIRRGIKWLYGLKEEPTIKQFEFYRKLYAPNETLASLYLWEITIQDLFKHASIEKI